MTNGFCASTINKIKKKIAKCKIILSDNEACNFKEFLSTTS